MTRIAVLGAGANGGSIGADLTLAGHDVTLIEQWPAHVEAMRADGLRIELPEETLQVPVRALHLCEVATLRERFDVVLMLMKAYDAVWATHLIRPYLDPDGLLVGVQNGMTAEAIADVVGPRRTLGCVIEITSMMMEPGVVERHAPWGRSWFAVGSMSDATAGREPEIADLLRCSGPVEIVEDIIATKWMKLVSNATTLVTTAIIDQPMIGANAIPEMRAFMLRSGQEALEATVGIGNPILPIFGLGPGDVGTPATAVRVLLDRLLDAFVLPHSRTTVLQDWMKGRHSEVGELNGHVVETLRALGRPAPANEAVVEVAGRVERGELAPGIENLALLLDGERVRSARLAG